MQTCTRLDWMLTLGANWLTRGMLGLDRCSTWLSGLADAALWLGSTGPWWTSYDPTSMVGSWPSSADLMAQEAR